MYMLSEYFSDVSRSTSLKIVPACADVATAAHHCHLKPSTAVSPDPDTPPCAAHLDHGKNVVWTLDLKDDVVRRVGHGKAVVHLAQAQLGPLVRALRCQDQRGSLGRPLGQCRRQRSGVQRVRRPLTK